MKTIVLALTVVLSMCGSGLCSTMDVGPIEYRIVTGPQFDWWKSDTDDKGTQFFAPLQISAQTGGFAFTMLTAYAYTTVDLDGSPDRSLTNLVDTKMNFSCELANKLPIDILLGLDLNLPTGKTKLEKEELSRMLDPDLVSIHNYGEGFNLNPTLIMAKSWKDFSVGMGIGYVLRGEYDYSDEFRDYDPGEIFNVTGEVAYFISDAWKTVFSVEYGTISKDELDGDKYYEEGDYYLLEYLLFHTVKNWDATFNLSALFRGKSKFQDIGGALSTEDKSGYGDEYEFNMIYRYFLNDMTTLKTQAGILWITDNDYSSDSPLFWGERKKYALGMGVVRKLTSSFDCEVFLRGFYMEDEPNWYNDENVNYTGINTGVLFSGYF